MWKKKKQQQQQEKRGRDEEEGGNDEDDGQEDPQGDGFRIKYADHHLGCIPIDTIKASPEYALRIPPSDDHPKRKYAVCFGYLGSAYQGLQINPNALTVEAVLLKAFLLSGSIEESNYENPQKIGWTRAARTDRGVHAISQVCAMKLKVMPNKEDELRLTLNSFLPADIRVFDVKRVTKSFNSKVACSGRRYQYLFPTYLLKPVAEVSALRDALGKFDKMALRNALISYRVSAEALSRLRDAFKVFEGTRRYHNFTYMKHPSDTSSQRYITSFTCSDPFVQGEDDVEWICVSIVGQSFLLNQIRKMVALVFEVVRESAPKAIFDEVFEAKNKIDFTMAPGVGLYLDKLFFEMYNRRLDFNAKHSSGSTKVDEEDDSSGRLEFDLEGSRIAEEIQLFRSGVVWDHVVSEEKSTAQFMDYIEELFHLKNDFVAKPFPAKDANNYK